MLGLAQRQQTPTASGGISRENWSSQRYIDLIDLSWTGPLVNWCIALLILIQITQGHQPPGNHPWAHRGSLVPMTHWRNKPSLLIYWINVALIHCLIHALMQCLWPIGSLVHNIVASDKWAHGFLEWSVDDTIDSYLLLASSNASDSSVRWCMSDCFNDSLILILLCIGPS